MKTVEILVYFGKHGNTYWLVDTPARKRAAMRELFDLLDEEGCYQDEDEEHLAACRQGKPRAIEGMLYSRQSAEYESFEFEYATIAGET